MQDQVIAILSHKRRLNAVLKDTPFEEMLQIQMKLNEIIAERRQEEEERQQRMKENQSKINEILSHASALDVNKNALLEALLEKKDGKYRYTDSAGQTKYWAGRGRKPKPIEEALKAGKSLDDFLA